MLNQCNEHFKVFKENGIWYLFDDLIDVWKLDVTTLLYISIIVLINSILSNANELASKFIIALRTNKIPLP